MKALITYGSQYGTTRKYAEKFSELTGFSAVSFDEIKDLSEYDTVIHFGGLYAGGVKGLKNVVKAIGNNTKIVIATVGFADVNDKENTDNIKKSLKRQVPENILSNASVFHLRGGIDYSKLNLKHKTMMKLLYNKAKKIPDEKKTAEVKAMIETYNSKVDFVDFSSLNPILKEVKK